MFCICIKAIFWELIDLTIPDFILLTNLQSKIPSFKDFPKSFPANFSPETFSIHCLHFFSL